MALKSFPCSPLTNYGPHLQSYLSSSQDEGEGKRHIRFIISGGDVAFILSDL